MTNKERIKYANTLIKELNEYIKLVGALPHIKQEQIIRAIKLQTSDIESILYNYYEKNKEQKIGI